MCRAAATEGTGAPSPWWPWLVPAEPHEPVPGTAKLLLNTRAGLVVYNPPLGIRRELHADVRLQKMLSSPKNILQGFRHKLLCTEGMAQRLCGTSSIRRHCLSQQVQKVAQISKELLGLSAAAWAAYGGAHPCPTAPCSFLSHPKWPLYTGKHRGHLLCPLPA